MLVKVKSRVVLKGKPFRRIGYEAKYKRAFRPALAAHARLVVRELYAAGVLEQFDAWFQARHHMKRDAAKDATDRAALDAMCKPYAAGIASRWNVGKLTEKLTRELGIDASRYAFARLGARAEWSVDSPHLAEVVAARQNLTKGLSDEVFSYTKGTLIEQWYGKGESPVSAGFVKELQAAAEIPTLAHAEAIARTEVGSVQTACAMHTYRDNGVEEKKWLHSGSQYERHISLAGVVKPMEEPFVTSSGHQMMQPFDGSLGAPAGEIVNCKCDVAPVVSDETLARIQDDGAVVDGVGEQAPLVPKLTAPSYADVINHPDQDTEAMLVQAFDEAYRLNATVRDGYATLDEARAGHAELVALRGDYSDEAQDTYKAVVDKLRRHSMSLEDAEAFKREVVAEAWEADRIEKGLGKFTSKSFSKYRPKKTISDDLVAEFSEALVRRNTADLEMMLNNPGNKGVRVFEISKREGNPLGFNRFDGFDNKHNVAYNIKCLDDYPRDRALKVYDEAADSWSSGARRAGFKGYKDNHTVDHEITHAVDCARQQLELKRPRDFLPSGDLVVYEDGQAVEAGKRYATAHPAVKGVLDDEAFGEVYTGSNDALKAATMHHEQSYAFHAKYPGGAGTETGTVWSQSLQRMLDGTDAVSVESHPNTGMQYGALKRLATEADGSERTVSALRHLNNRDFAYEPVDQATARVAVGFIERTMAQAARYFAE